MGLFNKKLTSQGLDTAMLVSNFITKSEGLTRILEKETEYFKDRKVKQAEQLLETKQTLIDELESIKSSLLASPESLVNIAASEKARIKTASLNLQKAADANFNEAGKTQEVNRIILEAIAYAVNQSKAVEGAYSETGNAYNNNNANPVSVVTNV